MMRLADGIASILAAVLAAVLTLPCVWFTHLAIAADLAPVWGYGPAGLLALVGVILTVAFLRKGLRGVAPSRDRAR